MVQGSGLGPSSFSVIGSDLKPINESVFMFKFADDMDFVTIMNNYQAVGVELKNVEDWASRNNMTLNMSKTKEIIFRRGREQVQIPEPHVGIQRYTTLNVLGIKLQDNLHMNEHVDDLIGECANNLYAMNVLRAHGMRKEGLEEVFRAKILSRIMYASPAWWGLASQRDIDRINGFLKKAKKLGYYPDNGLFFEDLCELADDRLFSKIENNPNHVLYKFLPEIKSTGYNLRKRAHPYSLPIKDDRNFMNRVLYKYSVGDT